MVDETRRRLGSAAYGQSYRRLADALLTRGTVSAVVVGVGLLTLLLVVFRLEPLTRLPSYPAVALAFAVTVVVPGLLLQRTLLASTGLDPLARLAVAPALGLAVAAFPGLAVLQLHLDLQAFAVLHAVFAGAACAAAAFFHEAPGASPEETPRPGIDGGGVVAAAVVAAALVGVLTSPVLAGDSVPANYDTWTYMGYVREYLDTDRINAEEPFLGTGESVNPRMLTDVWVLLQAQIADGADVEPQDVLITDLGPVLTVLAVFATYALTRALFRSRSVALLAMALQLGYAFLDLSPHEGLGRNLFLRISEDKMVADQLVFPIGLLLAVLFVSRPGAGVYLAFAGVALALSVVHPIPLFFLGLAVVALGAVRTATERSTKPLLSIALLAAPVALTSIGPFVQRMLLADAVPGIFQTGENSVTFRNEFRFIDVGAGMFIGNYHMLFHPLMIAAIVLVPLLWLRARREAGTQLIAAIAVAALVFFFVPPLSTLLAKVMTPQTLWRLPRMIPVAAVLAYGCALGAGALVAWTGRRAPRLRRTVASAAPAVLGVALLGAVLLLQEQYLRLDKGTFFSAVSTTSAVPGTDGSILLGGKDYLHSREWRLTRGDEALVRFMRDNIPGDSTILFEPLRLNHLIPGLLADIHPVDFGGVAGEGERREDANAYATGGLTTSQLAAVVDRYGVDFLVAREVGPAIAAVADSSRAEWITEIGPYQVYEVRQ